MSRARGRSAQTDTPCPTCGRKRTTSPADIVATWAHLMCPVCLATELKHCADCGEDKPLEDFYPDGSKPTKRSTYCRRCMKRRSRLVLAAMRILRTRHEDEFQVILEQVKTQHEGDT